jgi:uncharacterized membrane protein YcaP (DUF421 family)
MLPSDFVSEILPIIGKTSVVYFFILLGLKIVGRRALRGMGPQELILITLLAKVVGDHVVPENAGLMGNLVAGITLFAWISIVDRIPFLKKWVEGIPIVVYQNGTLKRQALNDNMLTEADLERTARDYGFDSIQEFEQITLEKDGRLTGIVKESYRQPDGKVRRDRAL